MKKHFSKNFQKNFQKQKIFKKIKYLIQKAIVLDWFWEKYLVKIIQNFTFKRGLTSYWC